MYYVYIIQSGKDERYYIGSISNIEVRLAFHNEGKNKSKKHRRPFKIIHLESTENKKDALRREREIKSYKGGNEFKKLINGRVA